MTDTQYARALIRIDELMGSDIGSAKHNELMGLVQDVEQHEAMLFDGMIPNEA